MSGATEEFYHASSLRFVRPGRPDLLGPPGKAVGDETSMRVELVEHIVPYRYSISKHSKSLWARVGLLALGHWGFACIDTTTWRAGFGKHQMYWKLERNWMKWATV